MALGIGSNKILGLAMADDGLVAAEVRTGAAHQKLLHSASFTFPADASLDAPEQLGQTLARFLHEQHITAKRVVVGIPAKWLVAKQASVPPVVGDELLSVLRMQVEREFRLDPRGLVIDCDAAAVNGHKPSSVLIAAAMRNKIEQLETMAQAAGLKTIAITSTGMVLASAVGRLPQASTSEALLQLTRAGIELTLGINGRLQLVRYLSGPALLATNHLEPDDPQIVRLAGEAMRTVSLSGGESRSIRIWNGVGLAEDTLAGLAQHLGDDVQTFEPLEVLHIRADNVEDHRRGAQAAVLAVCGAQPKHLPVNFLEPKLREKPDQWNKRKLVWLSAAVATAVIAIAVLLVDHMGNLRNVAAMHRQLAAQSGPVQQASDLVGKIRHARLWFDGKPRHLDVMRQVTLAFPEDGSVFATSMAVSEPMRIVLTGKSNDEQGVRTLLEKLQASASFGDVQLQYMRDADRSSSSVAFALDCQWIKTETTP